MAVRGSAREAPVCCAPSQAPRCIKPRMVEPASGLVPLDSVGEACFQELARDHQASNEVSDLLLLSLAHIYGKNFNKALEVLDEQRMVCYVGEQSRRTVVKVQGKASTDVYLVFPRHYCSCQAFFYKVVNESEAICCKHQLAVRLALALNRCPIVTISDVEIADLLAFRS